MTRQCPYCRSYVYGFTVSKCAGCGWLVAMTDDRSKVDAYFDAKMSEPILPEPKIPLRTFRNERLKHV